MTSTFLLMFQPPLLTPHATIGIACPSAYLDTAIVDNATQIIQQQGYKVVVGESCRYPSSDYFSASDSVRLADLNAMIADPNIHALLMGRGGYGLSRIIDTVNFRPLFKYPKWICGFSDITLLHTMLYKKIGLVSVHSSMAKAFTENTPTSVDTLLHAITQGAYHYTFDSHSKNTEGVAEGILWGGNLSLLAHSVPTHTLKKIKNSILFIEDVGEYLYALDRMLHQLRRAGYFQQLKGVICGAFTDIKDTQRPFGMNIYELLHTHFSPYDIPIAFDFPAGHIEGNHALLLGRRHRMEINKYTPSLLYTLPLR